MPSSVFVALVGRPNVGKSSLTNHLVGEKSRHCDPKAQTTRNRITGIITKGPVQYVLLDTPGIHKPRNRLDSPHDPDRGRQPEGRGCDPDAV